MIRKSEFANYSLIIHNISRIFSRIKRTLILQRISKKTKNMSEIILPKESYELMGVLFKVHNELGPIYKEKHYVSEIERKLILKNIPYFREKKLSEFFPNVTIKELIPDFVIRMCIIFDAKAWRRIKDEDIRQMCRYLDQTGLPLGIVANFRKQKLEYKRIINPKRDKTKWS